MGNIDRSWDEVSIGDIEVALQRVYPAVFPRANRVALAANHRVLRDCECVARWQEDEIPLQVILQYLMGGAAHQAHSNQSPLT